MRDPKRIDIVLNEIRRVWKANPDLRLMQLLLNAIGTFESYDDYIPKDHYNTEDGLVLRNLKETYK